LNEGVGSVALKITECPTCGSKRIRRMRRNFHGAYKGQAYVVPNLEFEQCPDCGERLFDHDAMQKIEEHSPAYAKRRAAGKKVAGGR
jgi:YgiT-type zinc finger domain-containing protein